jgi:hypothetical protein
MISNLVVSLGNYTNSELNVDLLRHMVLNSIRHNNTKFKAEYGELVICCDGSSVWRRDIFPLYKANRKKTRDESELDWKLIFNALHQIRDEINENFHYRVIYNDKCEADDVIATLCSQFGDDGFLSSGQEKILILSADKDFIQLHKWRNVKQYDPIRKKYVQHPKPLKYLKEHIIRGDSGDGVPNILTKDDVFVLGERQKNISSKKLEGWLEAEPKDFCTESMLRNWKRNEQLIDLTFTPSQYQNEIIDTFDKQEGKSKNIFNYFTKNKLKNLMEAINDF